MNPITFLKFIGTSFILLLLTASRSYAQVIGGDEIQSTVSNAGSYLQRVALLFFIITLIIGALRMATSATREGFGMLIGSMIGIGITALAPQIVTLVQSWTGIGVGLGF